MLKPAASSNGDPITSDPNSSFPSGVVPGYRKASS